MTRMPIKVQVVGYETGPFIAMLAFGIAVGIQFSSVTIGVIAWLGACIWRDG